MMQKLHHINAFLAVLFLTPFPALIISQMLCCVFMTGILKIEFVKKRER